MHRWRPRRSRLIGCAVPDSALTTLRNSLAGLWQEADAAHSEAVESGDTITVLILETMLGSVNAIALIDDKQNFSANPWVTTYGE